MVEVVRLGTSHRPSKTSKEIDDEDDHDHDDEKEDEHDDEVEEDDWRRTERPTGPAPKGLESIAQRFTLGLPWVSKKKSFCPEAEGAQICRRSGRRFGTDSRRSRRPLQGQFGWGTNPG